MARSLASISTHAPLRGATTARTSTSPPSTHFYSRASARRDHRRRPPFCLVLHFYSRASARRDVPTVAALLASRRFLLTRLCEARRPYATGHASHDRHFYSRASARRDAHRITCLVTWPSISTHAPLRGATWRSAASSPTTRAFLLTRLCEARHSGLSSIARALSYFYSRASARRDEPWNRRAALAAATRFLLTRLCEARTAIAAVLDLTVAPGRFLLTRLCEARPLHLVPNGSRISIYRKRRTFFRKSTMIQHFSYPDCTLF